MKKIKLFNPDVRKKEKESIQKVLDSHFWAHFLQINK
mgnify:CR=1 FL=1|tara:strand:+ start:767 stop:877 length:111 start_codon:yes stop_codon:yes gene_type:complete